MKRLKLRHNYHDSIPRLVETSALRMTFSIQLSPAVTSHLFFEGVRNMDELREQFGLAADEVSAEIGAEIVGIARDDDGRILVDLMKIGSVRIDCKNLSES